jgi:uncharacterized protein YecE (DUF72 family)
MFCALVEHVRLSATSKQGAKSIAGSEMSSTNAQLHIGTSGWMYNHWKDKFYPSKLAKSHWLEFYSDHFQSAEVNFSFYRLPKPETYEKWTRQVPPGFIFSLKASRLITHAKRLANCDEVWDRFLTNARHLGPQLGPILFQFPENFELNFDRLRDFLQLVDRTRGDLRLAFEFRSGSWLNDDIYRLLAKYNASFCIADSPLYPRDNVVTADFVYYRFHGRIVLFASEYSRRELEDEARAIDSLLHKGKDVFVYFNNDGFGYAVKNAETLQRLLGIDHHSSRSSLA